MIAAVAVVAVVVAGLTGAVVLAGGSDGSGPSDGSERPGGEATDDVRTVQPGAPGEAGRELTDEEVAAIEAPPHTAADTEFMEAMLAHHAQALEMADLVADGTDSEDVDLLAERIVISQNAEIELMEQWLTDRGETVPPAEGTAAAAAGGGHAEHAGMPGMATPDQLAALGAARGPAFDTLFLELMIAHHQGAVTMVEELYESGGGVEPAADALAREIEADQNIEILRMTDMLTARRG